MLASVGNGFCFGWLFYPRFSLVFSSRSLLEDERGSRGLAGKQALYYTIPYYESCNRLGSFTMACPKTVSFRDIAPAATVAIGASDRRIDLRRSFVCERIETLHMPCKRTVLLSLSRLGSFV